MSMAYAIVNDISLHYKIFGEGFPVLCIHGFNYKKEEWEGQFEALSRYFQVIAFDNRGCGKSERPEIPYTIETMADDVKGLMDFLNIKQAHIMGMSMGGMIAQNFVLKYPERVNKVVLMNTNHTGAGWELLKGSQINGLELRKSDPEREFWDYAKVVFHPKFRKELQNNPLKKWYGIWSAEDLKNHRLTDPSTKKDVENQAYALSTHNTTDRLHEIKNPTLILAASHDRACPKSELMFMHEKIPNSSFKVIEKTGHFSFLSKAPEINQILIKFLSD